MGTGKLLRTLYGHQDTVISVSISPDGKTLASGSGDKTIKIWEIGTGKLLRTLYGHQDTVISVSISPDGKTLASSSGSFLGLDKTIKIWDVATGNLLLTLYGHQDKVISVSISPDGKTLVSGSSDNIIKIWSLNMDLDSLTSISCNKIGNYLLYSNEVKKEDRNLCNR
jgi:WD40 repeat protein